jgi:hypothetical protein
MIYLIIYAAPLVLLAVVMAALLAEPRFRRGRKARGQAEEKGFALLRAWLTPEQATQWDARNEFEVIGCDTGTRYLIRRGMAMNVHQLDCAGRDVARWCFSPEGGVVTGDVLLAQKSALETMEREVLALANRSPAMAVRPAGHFRQTGSIGTASATRQSRANPLS